MAIASSGDLIVEMHSDVAELKTAMTTVQADVRQVKAHVDKLDGSVTTLATAFIKVADTWSRVLITVQAQDERLVKLEGLAQRVESVEERVGRLESVQAST
jgi:hypothetical protein